MTIQPISLCHHWRGYRLESALFGHRPNNFLRGMRW